MLPLAPRVLLDDRFGGVFAHTPRCQPPTAEGPKPVIFASANGRRGQRNRPLIDLALERDFLSTWDLVADGFFLLFDHGIYDPFVESSRCNGLDNAKLLPLLTKRALAKLRGDQIAKGCVRDPTRSARADRKWVGFGAVI